MTAASVMALVLGLGGGARAAFVAAPVAAARGRLAGSMPGRLSGGGITPPRWLVRRLADSGLRAEVAERIWPAAPLVAIPGVIGATALYGMPGLLLASAACAVSSTVLIRRLAVRHTRRRARALPLLLEDVARGLRSGASLRQALVFSIDRADASLQPDLRIVCDAIDNGGSLGDALERWRDRQPAEGLRLAVAALTLGIDAGGAHGRALDAVAASLRDHLAVEGELAALSSQARASAAVMAVAPVLFAAVTVTADRRTAHFLLGTGAGLGCLVGGLLLDVIAGWWMWQLTEVAP